MDEWSHVWQWVGMGMGMGVGMSMGIGMAGIDLSIPPPPPPTHDIQWMPPTWGFFCHAFPLSDPIPPHTTFPSIPPSPPLVGTYGAQ